MPPIIVEPLPGDRSRYRLHREHRFTLPSGAYTIPAGYTYDGASVPTVVGLSWQLTARREDSRVMRAALEHDWLCETRPTGTTSRMAAHRFRAVLVEDGLASWRAAIMYRAVLWGGPRW